MTAKAGHETPSPHVPSRSPGKHHWWRWILAGVAALVALVVVAIAAFIKLQPTAAPLALPTSAAHAPVGPLDGTWAVAPGSVAGFRVQESALGIGNDVVGRTNAVTGTMVVSGGRVTSAAFRIDLTAITVGGRKQPQFAASLATQAHPSAAFTLTRPVALGSAFPAGATITARGTGRLTMNGTSHLVSFTISGRRDGPTLQAAGSIPVAFSDWGIKGPAGFGFLGSLASHGLAEFLLILQRSAGTGG